MTASQRLGTTDKAIAIFRKDKVTGRVLAVFPYNDGQPGTDRVILGYVHERYVQKSTESYGRFIARTAPTAPDEGDPTPRRGVDLRECRYLLDARNTPGRPEVDDDDVVSMVAHRHRRPRRVTQRQSIELFCRIARLR